jgi:hypothetical protein
MGARAGKPGVGRGISALQNLAGGEIAEKGELTRCLPKFSGLKRPNRF